MGQALLHASLLDWTVLSALNSEEPGSQVKTVIDRSVEIQCLPCLQEIRERFISARSAEPQCCSMPGRCKVVQMIRLPMLGW